MVSLLKSNILYIGTTNEFNIFHVGMTFDGRDPYDRWRKDAEYRKLPYLVDRVEFYNICGDTDHPYHEWIRNDGILDLKQLGRSRSPEVFEVPGETREECIANLKKSIENCLEYRKTGIRPFSKIFVPRPHQAWVDACILDRYDMTETVILPLDLTAREGKTLGAFSTFHAFKESGLKVMVVAAYWLGANESYIKELNQGFDITSDIAVISSSSPNALEEYNSALCKGQRILIDHSLHLEAEKIDQGFVDVISKVNKFVMIDEADFGAWCDQARSNTEPFISSGNNLICVATGTNIGRALIGSKGNILAPLTVTYLDLLEAKRGEGFLFDSSYTGDGKYEKELLEVIRQNPEEWVNRLANIVEIAYFCREYSSDIVKEFNSLSEENRYNSKKVFSKGNSHMVRSFIKHALYDELYGRDIFTLYETKFTAIEHPAVMLFIPGERVDVENLVNIGKSIAPHYNWIGLHGDNKYTNRNAEKNVLDIIKNGGGERTVIVSCSMGARSFSVPNIVAVVNCVDGGSVGTANQRSSRCLTPGLSKNIAMVVDYSFDTNRTSSFLTDLVSSSIKKDSSDVDSGIRRVYRLANFVKEDQYGYLVEETQKDFLDKVTCKDNLENMATTTIDRKWVLKNLNISSILKDVRKSKTNSGWSFKGSSGILSAKTYINDGEEDTRTKKEIDTQAKEVRKVLQIMQRVVQTVGNAYYLAPNSKTFKECLVQISNNDSKNESYKSLVGASADMILKHTYEGFNDTFMNLIISRVSKLDTYEYFENEHASHALGLFDLDSL